MNENPTPEKTEDTARELPSIQPAVDVFENADGYLIRADVPGVAEDAVDVHFDRGQLLIEARRETMMFRRLFELPLSGRGRIDAEHISAKLSQGVLELHVPKAADVKPRKIAVHAS